MTTPPLLDGTLPGGSPGAEVRVHPLVCGTAKAFPQYYERPRGRFGMQRALAEGLVTPRSRWVTMPLPAFLVEHPTAGPFMIDTGVSASHASDGGRGDLGRVGGAILGATMTPQMAAGAQVRALGHDPEQLPLVVMTHLHFDHLGGSDQFPGAEFLVAKSEWSDPPSSTKGTYGHHRDAVRRWRLLDDTASAGEPHDRLSRTWDLFGDGSVLLAWTPGHTPGHLSVVLRLRGGRPALLTADAAYARRTIDERLVPMLCPDVPTYLRSLDELRAYVAHTPDALVLAGHDAERWETDSAAIANA